MYINRKIIFLLSFCISINVFTSQAQGKHSPQEVAQATASQTPDIFNGYSLASLSADQLSDGDIATIRSRLQASGISYDQAEQIALSKGMPPAEWQKLKARLTGAPASGSTQNSSSTPATLEGAKRQQQTDDYLSYQKQTTTPKVFGASLFSTASLSFEPNLRIATPVNYILGADDELLINVSGYQETGIRAIVQPEGTIFLPHVGTIAVAGLTIEQATTRIQGKMAQTAYPSLRGGQSKLIISLGKIKSIHVTIIGAAKPGNYTISSLSTVFNSLFLCGGPGDINTYRSIELIRNNKIYKTIDLYQFLTRGDQQGNVPLQENDVINFPVYKKRVTVAGEVKRPGIFELNDRETLQDLLFFAGGFTERAYKASIKVKQVTDVDRKIKDLPKTENTTYEPQNGDEFEIGSILNRFENQVSVTGAVYRPGGFEFTPGLTISSLIKRAGGLQENVFTGRANLTRTYANGTKENITFNVAGVMGGVNDIPLVKRDSIHIAFENDFRSDFKVTILGEVRKPGDFEFKQNLSLKDVLFMAGGVTDAASSFNVEVGRRIVDQSLHVSVDSIAEVYNVTINGGLGIENDKFVLQPFDIVTVRRNPGYTEQKRVTINGEVTFPGSYTIELKNERVSSLIKRAGGLSPLAYKKGVFLIRKNTDADQANDQSVKTVQKKTRDTTTTQAIDNENRENNRIAINLEQVLKEPGSMDDYILQDGDMIQVLKIDPLVRISGEVLAPTKTGFIESESLNYYLTQAGGTTENARRSKIYVVYPNGRVNKTRNGFLGLFRSYPKVETGAEIIVPHKKVRRALTTGETIGLTSTIVSLISLVIITITNIHK
ncbi:MAG TPA: SLBB domain-containing protein [Mucilaginibacter sp.]|nr:SLBB domain-containing protein [Mucilaginibacter sp.]